MHYNYLRELGKKCPLFILFPNVVGLFPNFRGKG